MKTHVLTKPCISVHKSITQYKIANSWMDNMGYMNTMEYYLAIKMSDWHTTTWMNLEDIMLSQKEAKLSHDM